jgi:S-adenosylmethionine:tRNA ribosyltransferase-isomerase
MKLEDFGYHLPGELIAQTPCDLRNKSRMMVVKRRTGDIECRIFHDLPEFAGKGNVLVINDTKVIPARLIGKKSTGGMIEILLLSRMSGEPKLLETWQVLIRPAKRVRVGAKILFNGECEAQVIDRISEKKWIVSFATDLAFADFLKRYGRTPLPPYITRHKNSSESLADVDRYQTIYARFPGSIAAPTAGLHFSQNVLDTLENNGVYVVPVTLHVGYGTFLPIEADDVEDHVMEEEFFEITPEAAKVINSAKKVIAVGTTSTRVLESAADEAGKIKPCSAYTRLFIYPGYRFKRVDTLITNFHLPRSSLYILVCAFAGKYLTERAYKEAVRNRFRFYSYGDCMIIL